MAGAEREPTRLCDCMDLPLTCGSEEALQWYNKGVFAFLTLRESPLPYFDKALELDPSFLLTHCFLGCFWLMDLKLPSDPRVAPHLEVAKSTDLDKITEREKGHVKAFLAYGSGDLPQATEDWATLLVDYPHDLQAIRLLFGSYIMLGEYERMRDFLASLLPLWREDSPYFPFVISFYAFSLEETNKRDKAEELAREALSLDRRTPWATHTLSHVIEEEQDAAKGVEFLTSTREDWGSSLLEGHLTWHLTLYYCDMGDTDAALHEFDTVLFHKVAPESLFGILDSASLLWRLELLGVDPGEKRWGKVTESCSKCIGKHGLAWLDVHLMMSLAHGKVSESAARLALCEQMIKSLQKYIESDVSTNCRISDMVGAPICDALLAYGREQYDEVLSLMLPLRYDIVRLGGSYAQRQVFNLTMIQAAINGKKTSLALALVAELKAQKPKSRLLARLFQELKAAYDREKGQEPEPKRVKLN